MKYGLIGEKLGHSFSVSIHNAFGNPDYVLHEIPRDELDEFMRKKDFLGINVTIPYKQDVMKYCVLDEAAKEIGAVNTIVNRDGVLYGYNTDAFGLSAMMDFAICGKCAKREECRNSESDFSGKNAVILGAGGTAKTARYVLGKKNIDSVTLLARNVEKARESFSGKDVSVASIEGELPENVKNAEIVVNTTPVGMYPKNDGVPVSLDDFTNLECVFDVVYNPLTTLLVAEAEEKGISAANGLYMLVMQALMAERLFFPEDNGLHKFGSHNYSLHNNEFGEAVYQNLRKKLTNIVLIGMPGSGKSTLGQILSETLDREFADTDTEFEKAFGTAPGAFIEAEGEEEFRKKETETVRKIAARNSLIIATGGGIVTRPENIRACKQNGILVYIKRDISNLSSDGRPLSKGDGAIEKLYEARKDLYEGAADYIVEADEGDAENTAKVILKKLGFA